MKDILKILFFLLCALPLASSCSSDDDDDSAIDDYSNWQQRNDDYFLAIRDTALTAIEQAQTLYADDWDSHSEWLTYRSYSLSTSALTTSYLDSIYVKVVTRGEGSGSPMSTDSVRIFYAGRLIPTDLYPDGYMFDHSGQSSVLENIFDRTTNIPSTFLVTACVRGLGTALQYMHIGDRWQVYIPYPLGYGSTAQSSVPAYSTLIFDVELLQYARSGSALPTWR